MLEQVGWRRSDVLSYLETKILENIASDKEVELYEEYRWTGKLKINNTYKNLVKELNKEYKGS
jgi:hypothetical protein